MIEFKQIIGRGTRLYEGKDYFTIYDFVRAHHHFADQEWDGEPLEPSDSPSPRYGEIPQPKPLEAREKGDVVKEKKTQIKLADGKVRLLQHMSATSFWDASGKPISATQFLESLFGALPEFFKNEDELRQIWSAPETRRNLLQALADRGFGRMALADMQKVIDADHSDLFDVLAYVAFASAPVSRTARASMAHDQSAAELTGNQQAFVDFVLSQYVQQGVDELDQEKLAPLLRLRYRALSDAFQELGQPDQVRNIFIGFQRHLYQGGAGSEH